MKIKTWINKKVEDFVKQKWPNKSINCNYTDDSSRMWEENRWIQVSTPIEDEYIHYEIIDNHIELHFENADSGGKGLSAHQELVDFLEQITENRTIFEWVDFLGGDAIACVYTETITTVDDMLDKLSFMVNYFDQEITNFLSNRSPLKMSEIKVENEKPKNVTICLDTMSLTEVFSRNLNIPSYQRIYCWEEPHVKRLLEDLREHYEQHKKTISSYRLGTVILHYHNGKYDIIDGQQRLVTLALLLFCLGIDSCLMEQKFSSSVAQEHIRYNKYLVNNFVAKHVNNRAEFGNYLCKNVNFSVLSLNNSSLDIAFTFFSNENSRGLLLSDYDLLKAHHLRFFHNTYEQQSEKAAETWNQMIKRGQAKVNDVNPSPDYETTLDTYMFHLRKWMRMEHVATFDNDRHVKNEYEAAPIIPEMHPFGECFYFNEPIQGGAHFFTFTEIHLNKYNQFIETKSYKSIHNRLSGGGSVQWYRNAIETLLFGYYEKFGCQYISDAAILILRLLLQNRYQTSRAQKDSIYKDISLKGVALMIDRATSPTFFLAELFNIIHDFPIKYLQQLMPIQRRMRSVVISIKNELKDDIFVESIKNIKI